MWLPVQARMAEEADSRGKWAPRGSGLRSWVWVREPDNLGVIGEQGAAAAAGWVGSFESVAAGGRLHGLVGFAERGNGEAQTEQAGRH